MYTLTVATSYNLVCVEEGKAFRFVTVSVVYITSLVCEFLYAIFSVCELRVWEP